MPDLKEALFAAVIKHVKVSDQQVHTIPSDDFESPHLTAQKASVGRDRPGVRLQERFER